MQSARRLGALLALDGLHHHHQGGGHDLALEQLDGLQKNVGERRLPCHERLAWELESAGL